MQYVYVSKVYLIDLDCFGKYMFIFNYMPAAHFKLVGSETTKTCLDYSSDKKGPLIKRDDIINGYERGEIPRGSAVHNKEVVSCTTLIIIEQISLHGHGVFKFYTWNLSRISYL